MRKISLMIGLTLLLAAAIAQSKHKIIYPAIGKPCPEFLLTDIHQFKANRISLDAFRGKWLVLDFFTTGCAACFEGFPVMNQLKKEFEGKVQFMLIGYDDQFIRGAYERFKQKYQLTLPISYNKPLFTQFGLAGVPQVMVIDPKGIVRAITYNIRAGDMQTFLEGGNPILALKPNVDEMKIMNATYDPQKPLLINGNGGDDTAFLFRSVLTKWNGILALSQSFISTKYYKARVQVVGNSLQNLYVLAYGDTLHHDPDLRGSSYGKLWPQPIIDVKDSEAFHPDFNTRANYYNYSLIIPAKNASSGQLREIMQRDLQNYFGYDVHVEKRKMPCWDVVVIGDVADPLPKDSLPSSDKRKEPYTGFIVENSPVQTLISTLFNFFQFEPPFIDRTGIQDNITLNVNAVMTDLEDVRHSLNKSGLDLVKDSVEMKVIVIRDEK